MIISISGMDNAGKSTQCELLNRMYPNTFPLILHMKDMPAFKNGNHDEKWWFEPGNEEDFCRVIFKSLQERIELANAYNEKVVLFDKGTDFYDARVISTLIVKGMTFKDAFELMNSIKKEYIQEDHEDMKLFLESGRHRRRDLDKSNAEDLRYNTYIEINKLILKQMHIEYVHVPANDIHIVTSTILGCIDYNLEGKCDNLWNQKSLIKKMNQDNSL